MSKTEVRGVSAVDRIALRVVSGILILANLGVYAKLHENTTELAVLKAGLISIVGIHDTKFEAYAKYYELKLETFEKRLEKCEGK